MRLSRQFSVVSAKCVFTCDTRLLVNFRLGRNSGATDNNMYQGMPPTKSVGGHVTGLVTTAILIQPWYPRRRVCPNILQVHPSAGMVILPASWLSTLAIIPTLAKIDAQWRNSLGHSSIRCKPGYAAVLICALSIGGADIWVIFAHPQLTLHALITPRPRKIRMAFSVMRMQAFWASALSCYHRHLVGSYHQHATGAGRV